jgi:deoxyribonuclease V
LNPTFFPLTPKGWVHPYRYGFASHLGLAWGKPTVGAAKSRLIGTPVENESRILLIDNDEVIGEVVITEMNRKPI